MTHTPVTGLDIEAIQKRASPRIGSGVSDDVSCRLASPTDPR